MQKIDTAKATPAKPIVAEQLAPDQMNVVANWTIQEIEDLVARLPADQRALLLIAAQRAVTPRKV
ncbi:MAG: hypothetical protein ACJ8AW_31415 [Rhodopila sp.]